METDRGLQALIFARASIKLALYSELLLARDVLMLNGKKWRCGLRKSHIYPRLYTGLATQSFIDKLIASIYGNGDLRITF